MSQVPPELLEVYREYEAVRPMVSEPFVLYSPAKVRM